MIGGELRKQHPRAWPWSSEDPEDESNQRFVERAVALANAFHQGLVTIGAFNVDPWAYYMPSDASASR